MCECLGSLAHLYLDHVISLGDPSSLDTTPFPTYGPKLLVETNEKPQRMTILSSSELTLGMVRNKGKIFEAGERCIKIGAVSFTSNKSGDCCLVASDERIERLFQGLLRLLKWSFFTPDIPSWV